MAVQKIILDIQAKVKKAQQDINKLKNTQKGLNKEVGTTATLMKKAAGALAAFASIGVITKAIRDMIALNVEFEKTLANVLTLLDATSKVQFREFLSVGALTTMRKYGLEIQDVNKALFDTISAGIKAGNSIRFINQAAKLAVAGVTDLSSAVKGMTSIMNAYDLSIESANKVASAFFTAQKFGTTTVGQLVESVGRVAPVAKLAGIGFEEMLAAMALLTVKGLSTEEAATGLRATINALINTTDESAAAFEKLEIQTGIAAIRANGLGRTLLQVAQAVDKDADSITQLIPNIRALNAVAALGTEALTLFDEIVLAIKTDLGEASSFTEAFTEQMKTMAKQADVTKGAWKEYRIEFFESIKGTLLATAVTSALTAMLVNATEKMRGYTNTVIGPIGAVASMLAMKKAAEDAKEALEKLNETIAVPPTAPTVPGEIPSLLPDVDDFGFTIDAYTELLDVFRKEEMEENRIWTDAFLQMEMEKTKTKIDIARGASGILQGLAGESFLIQKALAIAESIVSTYLGAQLAFQSQAWIPGIGPVLGAAARQQAIIRGWANTAIIAGTAIAGFEEGGFTGGGGSLRDSKGKRITGFTHENEYVLNEEKTRVLRPMLDDIHYNRIDIHGLAALTRRGTMKMMPKLNADLLERQVEKIYKKMSEEQPEKATIIYTGTGYVKKIGNTTINVNT